jgi:Flp pilus assembly protein TadD
LLSLLCFLFFYADPVAANSLLQRGLLALQSGQLTEARSDFEQASKIAPTNAYVWSSLAEVYLRLHDTKLASSAASSAEKVGGENPVVCHALAMYYSETGQSVRAAQLEERFAESPKADAGALHRAAVLYLDGGDPQRALELAQKDERQHPSAAAESVLGRALAATGQGSAAEPHLRAAWESDKTDSRMAFDWAEFLLRKGDSTGAADVVQAALAAHPGDSQLTLTLGVARYGQRRFDEAISEFLQVIQIDPGIEQPYVFLGRMLDQAGARLPEITKDYEKWQAKDPSNAEAQYLLAKALLEANAHAERAEPLLRSSIRLKPDDWESHYELGVLLTGKRDYKGARDELMRSVELSPKQPMSHYHLARVYDRLGEPERAKAEREIHRQLTTGKEK